MTNSTPASKKPKTFTGASTSKSRNIEAQRTRVTLTSPAYRDFGIPSITRSYTYHGKQGRFSASALEEAATRALECVALPNVADVLGDAWDARVTTIYAELYVQQAIKHAREGNYLAAGMEQIARELTVQAGRAASTREGDVFLKLALLSEWLGVEHLGFSIEITAYLTEMISRDCAELDINEDTFRERASAHFPRLRQER